MLSSKVLKPRHFERSEKSCKIYYIIRKISFYALEDRTYSRKDCVDFGLLPDRQ